MRRVLRREGDVVEIRSPALRLVGSPGGDIELGGRAVAVDHLGLALQRRRLVVAACAGIEVEGEVGIFGLAHAKAPFEKGEVKKLDRNLARLSESRPPGAAFPALWR